MRNCKGWTLNDDGEKLRHGFVEFGSEEIGEADIHLSGFVGWIDLENLVELDEGQFRLPRIRQRQSEIIAGVQIRGFEIDSALVSFGGAPIVALLLTGESELIPDGGVFCAQPGCLLQLMERVRIMARFIIGGAEAKRYPGPWASAPPPEFGDASFGIRLKPVRYPQMIVRGPEPRIQRTDFSKCGIASVRRFSAASRKPISSGCRRP